MKKTTSATPTPKTYTETTIRNFILDSEEKMLTCEKVTSTYELAVCQEPDEHARRIVKEDILPLKFFLEEVTVEEILQYRKDKVPCLVLKDDNRYYLTVIPKNLTLISPSNKLGTHLCKTCEHLSAASDADGGCAKVRAMSNYIQNYPWIKRGIETFNTKLNCFMVFECEKYEDFKKQPSYTALEIKKMKAGLAYQLWDDVISYRDVQKKIQRNLEKC